MSSFITSNDINKYLCKKVLLVGINVILKTLVPYVHISGANNFNISESGSYFTFSAMPPNKSNDGNFTETSEQIDTNEIEHKVYKQRYIPKHVILFLYVHLSGFYGLYLAATAAKWETIVLSK